MTDTLFSPRVAIERALSLQPSEPTASPAQLAKDWREVADASRYLSIIGDGSIARAVAATLDDCAEQVEAALDGEHAFADLHSCSARWLDLAALIRAFEPSDEVGKHQARAVAEWLEKCSKQIATGPAGDA
jgi:hypothetical protein